MNGEGNFHRLGFVRRNTFLIWILILSSLLAATTSCVISPRRVAGGGSPTPTPSGSPTPTPTSSGKLYVSNEDANSILRFNNAFTANGNVTPGAIISGTATALAKPQSIALDTAADRLYVANFNGSSVLIWDAISTRTGNVAPTRIIGGVGGIALINPSDVALDKGRDLLYVADGPEVFVFSPASTVNGNVAPARDITVAGFTISGMFLDATNDRLFLSDGTNNAVNVFDSASVLTGTILVPSRRITGAATTLNQPTGLALDANGNLVVANQGNGSITVFSNAATANGNVAPLARIAGTSTTLLTPMQIVRNTGNANNEIYVADTTANEVAVFSGVQSLNGNVSPSRSISGSSTTFTGVSAHGVALDPTR